MKPPAFQIFIDLLEMIDNIDGYGPEIGLVKTFDAAKDKFESDQAALRAEKSKSSAAAVPPAPSAAAAKPKVSDLPPNWTTRISRSTGNVVYQHPHCAPTYTHPRDITPKLLLNLISKKFGEKKKLNGWTISASSSKNGYIKYIKDGKAQYENPFDLTSKHRDTRKKSTSNQPQGAASTEENHPLLTLKD